MGQGFSIGEDHNVLHLRLHLAEPAEGLPQGGEEVRPAICPERSDPPVDLLLGRGRLDGKDPLIFSIEGAEADQIALIQNLDARRRGLLEKPDLSPHHAGGAVEEEDDGQRRGLGRLPAFIGDGEQPFQLGPAESLYGPAALNHQQSPAPFDVTSQGPDGPITKANQLEIVQDYQAIRR